MTRLALFPTFNAAALFGEVSYFEHELSDSATENPHVLVHFCYFLAATSCRDSNPKIEVQDA